MDNTQEHNEQRILSLCSGGLGIEKGIHRTGLPIRTITYVEIEAFCQFNLVAAMEAGLVDKAPIWTDCKTFNAKPFRNRIHGIVGGYPCQGESAAGLRKLEKDPRFLWPHFERIIKQVNPIWCFFENVDGHLSGTFPYVLRSLRNMGYVVEAGVFSAAEVGASHIRKRIFILACSDIDELRRCMANTNSKCRGLSKKVERNNGVTASQSSHLLGNSLCEGLQIRDERRNTTEKSRAFKRRKSSGANPENGILANANGQRIREGSSRIKAGKPYQNGEAWPARPGCQQYEWEELRTIESGVGCTVNGYNFRTELLRMYGNGVVEQTAELGWSNLTNKLFNL